MYELIEHQRVTTTALSITFSNIPQTYTDLYVVFSGRSNRDTAVFDNIRVMPNGATTGVSSRMLYGSGSAVSSFNESYVSGYTNGDTATANTFGNSSIYIPNYTSSAQKSFSMDSVSENNATAASQVFSSGLWTGTSAITSLVLDQGDGSSWRVGTTASLYGVNRTSGRGRPKAIGGNITYSNGYWLHTFTGSGTFSATQSLNVDALVVGGGGGGGSADRGGGGGAGGFRTVPPTSLAIGAHAVVVGAGGSGLLSSNGGTQGFDGTSSSFLSVTSLGGGGGGAGSASGPNPMGTAGRSGGSGGGGGVNGNSGQYSWAGGSGTAGQGNNGGSSGHDHTTYGKGGGGGGAGGVGASISANGQAGTGGIGLPWNGNYYAGGGGGAGDGSNGTGPGGLGGGGNAGFSGSPAGQAGTANTGGGGGAGWFNPNASSGAGGSGVVIIRYPAHEVQTVTYAEGLNQYRIDPATIQGAWTFETSEDSTYGGHTTTDYGSVGSIQSTNRKWPQYAGALQTNKVDSNNAGMRISSATNWTMSNEQTVEMWVKPFSGGTLGKLFIWGNRQDNACTMIDRDTSTGQLLLRTNTGLASTTGYAPYDEWSWVVLSKRGSDIRLFVNGIQVYQNSNGDGNGYTSDGRYFTIGADWDSGYVDAPRYSGGAYWQDVVVYNTAPFHGMTSIAVPTVPLTARIG